MRFIDNEIAVLAEVDQGLALYDIKNPNNCVELDHYFLSNVHDLELDYERELIFIASSAGVNIFNYSNPNQLELLSIYHNFTSCLYIQLKGELLLIGAEDRGLQIVNVSNPLYPIMIDEWVDSTGRVGPVYIMDDYIFVGTRIPDIGGPPIPIDLKILNISDPHNITYLSTVHTGEGYAGGAPKAHHKEKVYLNDYKYGLKVLNFTDPLNVTLLGSYFDGGIINDVKLLNEDIAFLADDSNGLKILNCSDAKNPIIFKSYHHQWRTVRVSINNDRIYLGTIEGGVRILSTRNPNGIGIHPFFIIFSISITFGFLLYRIKIRKENY
ncbi:MAG: hypothetical protein P8Y70_07340 [Candidatus Lokiarchaeota archaeon]